MSTQQAELIITPEISRSAMMGIQRDFDKSFDKIGRDAKRTLKKDVSRGMKEGGKEGARSIKGMLGGLLGKAGGAGGLATMGIAAALGGVALSAAEIARSAASGRNSIEGMLNESQAQQQIAVASSAGLSNKEYVQLSQQFKVLGGVTDQRDIDDFIFDITEKIGEAKIGDSPLLNQFTDFEGSDRINRVLASLAHTEDRDLQATLLGQLGFTGEAGAQVLALMNAVKGTDYEDTIKNLETEQSSQAEILAKSLEKEAGLAALHRASMLEQEAAFKQDMLNAIDMTEINTLAKARQIEYDQRLADVQTFNETQDLVNTTNAALVTAQDELKKATIGLTAKIGEVVSSLPDWNPATGFIPTEGVKEGASNISSYMKGIFGMDLTTEERDANKQTEARINAAFFGTNSGDN